MTKKEAIWRDLLVQTREKRRTVFTQKELAEDFGFSLSTVFNALEVPRRSYIIEVSGKGFRLESYQKLLYLWASERSFARSVLYQAHLELGTKKIEALLPAFVQFGLYSAYAFIYQTAPADYDHVYIYTDPESIEEVLERLPRPYFKSKSPNFFILKTDPWIVRYKKVPLEQIFVDIWNAPEWYAKDFLTALEKKLPI